MSKLSPENKFFDLSDYGRLPAQLFAKALLKTPFTPVHVTCLFLVAGVIAIYFMLQQQYVLAGLFLVIKSIIDAADGELARLRNKPSYIGRYLDSVFDLILNFAILFTINYLTKGELWMMIVAFIALQLQGTVFNYYYTILRNNLAGGDTTSRVEEKYFPKALHGENQQLVNILFIVYTICYGGFDRIILLFDGNAKKLKKIPNWFMTFVSIYGLGFQLLLIAIMLILGLIDYIIPFFIAYSIFIILLIGIRKIILKNT
ncbi:MAG: CDP-alcohol phosphatidyltransferase [Flavobacteriales bacterium]|nr:MAG: CDP-alcohol phosphatidyltransferase [Flavobacteriales bacterium]